MWVSEAMEWHWRLIDWAFVGLPMITMTAECYSVAACDILSWGKVGLELFGGVLSALSALRDA